MILSGASVKKILFILPALVLLCACTPMEEKRDASMAAARQAEQQGQCDTAVEEAQKAAELDPLYLEAFLLLGRCEMKTDKRPEAARHFARALELAPDSIEALVELCRIALLDGETDKAAAYAAKAAALGDSSMELTVLRSGILMKQENFADAVPLLESVVAANPEDEEALTGLASAYLKTGEDDKAKALLEKALKAMPDSPAVLARLASMAADAKDYAAAMGYTDALLALKPGDSALMLRRAEIAALAGNMDDSRRMLMDYLDAKPEAADVRLRLAGELLEKGDFDKALELLSKAPEQTGPVKLSKAGVLIQAGRVDEAVALLQAMLSDDAAKDQADEVRLTLAEIAIRQNRPQEAEEQLNALLAQDANTIEALMMRGQLYFMTQRIPQAMTDFEAVIKEQPDNLYAPLALADAYYVTGKPEQAEALITDVIRRAPAFGQAYIALGNLYFAMQQPEAALMTLALGRGAAPDDMALAFTETDALVRLKRYSQARTVLEALAKRTDNNPAVLFRLASVHGAAGEHAKAVAVFDRILAADPGSFMAAEGRVRAQIAAKQEKAALAFAEKHQKDRPDDPAAAYLAGEAALANKDPKKAEQAFLRAVNIAPQWDQPLSSLMQLYSASGRIDDAMKLCRELLGKAPDAVGPAVLLAMLQEQKGELSAAESGYRNLLIKQPDMLLAANNLAFLLTRHKPSPERLQEAEELALRAASSEAPATLDTLGWIQHLQGKNDEAEANLRKARTDLEGNPAVLYHLAATLAAQGKAATDKAVAKQKRDEAIALLQDIANKKFVFPNKADADALLKTLKAAK